jgi:transposase
MDMQATLDVMVTDFFQEETRMSTSLLYHAFGIRGYRHVRTDYGEGAVLFTITQNRHTLRCPVCGSADVTAHGGVPRLFRGVPIGRKPTAVFLTIPRVECHLCQITRQVDVPFAEPRRRHTRAFERYALELGQHMTIQDVAQHLGVSWDTIKEIQKSYLQQHYGKPKLHKLKQIAIDEIAIAKGHRYLTVVLDLVSGAVVFVGDGKGAAALDPFWRRLRACRAKIRAVATDMSVAYIQAVREHLPRAVHVFDHFHVIKLFNDKLTAFRRELYHEATTKLHKAVLKGTRWLLLKNPENLDPQRNERARLEEALRINQPLATVYYMKEDLRQLWGQPDKRTAGRVLQDWIRRAEASGIKILQQFAGTLAMYRTGILAYYDFPISTGPLEGTNNKIKTMKRQAYGFRDKEFLKLKIYAIHMTKYALVG